MLATYADDDAWPEPAALERQHSAAAVAVQDASRHDHSRHQHSQGGSILSTDGHTHDHSDPATKNAVSRGTGGTVSGEAADPTTAREAARARNVVADQRSEPDPEIVPIAKSSPRRAAPQNRYAMAGCCYAAQLAQTGRWVTRTNEGYHASAKQVTGAEPFHFQATDLGRYLLFDGQQEFVAASAPFAERAHPRDGI